MGVVTEEDALGPNFINWASNQKLKIFDWFDKHLHCVECISCVIVELCTLDLCSLTMVVLLVSSCIANTSRGLNMSAKDRIGIGLN